MSGTADPPALPHALQHERQLWKCAQRVKLAAKRTGSHSLHHCIYMEVNFTVAISRLQCFDRIQLVCLFVNVLSPDGPQGIGRI